VNKRVICQGCGRIFPLEKVEDPIILRSSGYVSILEKTDFEHLREDLERRLDERCKRLRDEFETQYLGYWRDKQ